MNDHGAVEAWDRRRLLLVLGTVAVVVAALVVGLVLAIVRLTGGGQAPDPVAASSDFAVRDDGTRGQAYRDALAREPMLRATAQDLKPTAPALEPAAGFDAPASTSVDEGIPTGFPQTSSGAVAQLAAIDVAALTPMSVDTARSVFTQWADPAAEFDSWPIALAIQSFHASAGTVDGDPDISTEVRPVGAQIKGTDGDAWVIACVQFDVKIALLQQTRFGYGHCERMEWVDGRWRIAAGEPPAPAPSTWPGSERSTEAGWLTWVDPEEF